MFETPKLVLRASEIREALEAILHTILFNRAAGIVEPEPCSSFDGRVSYVRIRDTNVQRTVIGQIETFGKFVRDKSNFSGALYIKFTSETKQEGLFSWSSRVAVNTWEKWRVPIDIVSHPVPIPIVPAAATAATSMMTTTKAIAIASSVSSTSSTTPSSVKYSASDPNPMPLNPSSFGLAPGSFGSSPRSNPSSSSSTSSSSSAANVGGLSGILNSTRASGGVVEIGNSKYPSLPSSRSEYTPSNTGTASTSPYSVIDSYSSSPQLEWNAPQFPYSSASTIVTRSSSSDVDEADLRIRKVLDALTHIIIASSTQSSHVPVPFIPGGMPYTFEIGLDNPSSTDGTAGLSNSSAAGNGAKDGQAGSNSTSSSSSSKPSSFSASIRSFLRAGPPPVMSGS